MKIVFLGTGSWFPQADRMGPSVLVTHEETTLLVDCGEGSVRRLMAAGVDPASVDAVLFTHTHPDHLAGLLPFLFFLRVQSQRKSPLLIAGPPDILGIIDGLAAMGDPELFEKGPPIERRAFMPPAIFKVGPFTVTSLKVEHREISVGYRIEAGGSTVALSGDSGPCEELVSLARDAGLFICEAGTPSSFAGHMTPEEAGAIGHKAGAKKMCLVHLPPASDPIEFANRCAGEFGGPVNVPGDLQIGDSHLF